MDDLVFGGNPLPERDAEAMKTVDASGLGKETGEPDQKN
jgi:hypothetical protein